MIDRGNRNLHHAGERSTLEPNRDAWPSTSGPVSSSGCESKPFCDDNENHLREAVSPTRLVRNSRFAMTTKTSYVRPSVAGTTLRRTRANGMSPTNRGREERVPASAWLDEHFSAVIRGQLRRLASKCWRNRRPKLPRVRSCRSRGLAARCSRSGFLGCATALGGWARPPTGLECWKKRHPV